MDIALARTFLEIVRSGNFARAAERLHVTQTAVSVRVQTLEEQLGGRLFVRSKAGATLTRAGEQFLRIAPLLVQLWERARHQVAAPPGVRAVLSLGGELSLWNPFLLDWLVWMRRSAPQLGVRAQVRLPEELMSQVAEGVIDIAVMYAPQQRPGLKIELIAKEKLVLVTTRRRPAGAPTAEDYVYVDWGPDFAAHHDLSFPQLSNAGTYVDLGPLGLQFILNAGGSGYFRAQAVAPYLKSGRLKLVRGAPEFMFPAYAVYAEAADPKIIAPALAGLRHVAAAAARVRSSPRRQRSSSRG
ncbi:MAG TPA: LysR family transcriptional regulator [Burkholderiales bacterium]